MYFMLPVFVLYLILYGIVYIYIYLHIIFLYIPIFIFICLQNVNTLRNARVILQKQYISSNRACICYLICISTHTA